MTSAIPEWLNPTPFGDVGRMQLPGDPQQLDVLSEDQLRQMREQLFESVLSTVVQAVRGIFFPGPFGAAFEQLFQWGQELLNGESLLAAIKGEYTGDRLILLAIEAAFAPVRALIQWFGEPLVEWLTWMWNLFSGITPNPEPTGLGSALLVPIFKWLNWLWRLFTNVPGPNPEPTGLGSTLLIPIFTLIDSVWEMFTAVAGNLLEDLFEFLNWAWRLFTNTPGDNPEPTGPAAFIAVPVFKFIDTVWEMFTAAAGNLLEDLFEFLNWMWRLFTNTPGDNPEPTGPAAFILVPVFKLIDTVWEMFTVATGNLLEDLFEFLKWLWDLFGGVVETVLKPVFTWLRGANLQSLTPPIINTIWSTLNDGAEAIGKTFADIATGIGDFVDGLTPAITGQPGPPGLGPIATWARGVIDKTLTWFDFKTIYGEIPEKILGVIPIANINLVNPELMTQGGFDTSISLTADTGWEWDGTTTRSGSGGSAKVTGNGTARSLYSNQSISVAPGDLLYISCWVKSTGTVGAGAITLSVVEFTETEVAATQSPGSAIASRAGSASFVQIGSTEGPPAVGTAYEVPVGVTSIRVKVAVTAGAATGSTVWFDDISVKKTGLLSGEWMNGALGTVAGDIQLSWNELYDGFDNSTTPAGTRRTPAQVRNRGAAVRASAKTGEGYYLSGANILINPGFDDPEFAILNNGVAVTANVGTGDVVRSGTRSLRLVAAAGFPFSYLAANTTAQVYLPCTPGETYLFECWVRGKSTNTQATAAGGITLGITTYDSAKANPVNVSASFAAGTSYNADWVKISGKLVVPAGKSFFTPYVQLNSSTVTNGHTYYFDDAVVREITDAAVADAKVVATNTALYGTGTPAAAISVDAVPKLAQSKITGLPTDVTVDSFRIEHAADLAALKAERDVSVNQGKYIGINFVQQSNINELPSTGAVGVQRWQTTYLSGSGPTFGIQGGKATWVGTINSGTNRTARVVYLGDGTTDSDVTLTDYQSLRGVLADPPSFGGNSNSRFTALARVSSADSNSYVWARAYWSGSSLLGQIGTTVNGVETIWQQNIPLTWSTELTFKLGLDSNPRSYQVFSGSTLVTSYREGYDTRAAFPVSPTFSADGIGTTTGITNRLFVDNSRNRCLVVTGTAGTFTLTVGESTTGPIAWNATRATVETAVTGLASVGAGKATVTGTTTASPGLQITLGNAVDKTFGLSVASSVTGGSAVLTNRFRWTTSYIPVTSTANADLASQLGSGFRRFGAINAVSAGKTSGTISSVAVSDAPPLIYAGSVARMYRSSIGLVNFPSADTGLTDFFDTVVYESLDINGNVTNGTFTVSKSGMYMVTARVALSTFFTSLCTVNLQLYNPTVALWFTMQRGNSVWPYDSFHNVQATDHALSGTWLQYLNAGDVIRLSTQRNNTDGPDDVLTGSIDGAETYFSIAAL